MVALTPRERVELALSHREPDRVPIDLGATICTTITRTAHKKLKEFLGIQDSREIITHVMMDTVEPHEIIKKRYGVDFVTVRMKPPSALGQGRGDSLGLAERVARLLTNMERFIEKRVTTMHR